MEKPFSSTGDPKAASEAALLSRTGGTEVKLAESNSLSGRQSLELSDEESYILKSFFLSLTEIFS